MSLVKYLWILSGDDYRIIRKCRPQTKQRFALIGAVVALIAILCFVGSAYTFIKVFNSINIGIPLGVFFALMITNIYILILYTLSKDVLPHVPSTSGRIFSKGIRLLFVVFISFIVSKPIELLILSNKIDEDVAIYKSEKLDKYAALILNHYDKEIEIYNAKIMSAQDNSGSIYTDSFNFYTQLIQAKLKERDRLISEMASKINRSKFYVQSLLILHEKYPASWAITIAIAIIFLLPFILKSLIPESNQYYLLNKAVQTSIVTNHYNDFKKEYNLALRDYSELTKDNQITFHESYLNPPYNTVRKTKTTPESEESLRDLIYNG